jgi:hypothetical protein
MENNFGPRALQVREQFFRFKANKQIAFFLFTLLLVKRISCDYPV